ncbi:hypothetical protein Tsubulata_020992 [Turnera subulata]|uniref:RING-type domain-containing protein n=1 Tax=Turnera subulata TaxID=218843 RepID=A0A9Q0J220_9ROSI|nr:hypothetical protein Tsubulata_020992 [Turnera subulata]
MKISNLIVDSDSQHGLKVKVIRNKRGVVERKYTHLESTPELEIYEEDFMASGSDEEACPQISCMMDSLDITPVNKQQILYIIASSVRGVVRDDAPAGKKSSRAWTVRVVMDLKTTYWWRAMVPASRGSIAGLEKDRAVDFRDEDFHGEKSCCICLNEFQEHGVVKRMPCSHIFDDKCIDESHYILPYVSI